MELNFDSLNGLAIAACVVVGQVYLTVWFVVIFGERWAKEYGAKDRKQHTAEVPGYTYGIGLLCVVLLTLGLALLQAALKVQSISGGLTLGLFVALNFCVATAVPGYAFLKRWTACLIAVGSQSTLIVLLSLILSAWSS